MALEIAVVQRFLPPASRGGAGHFTAGLCAALAGRGHRVTIFSQDPAPSGAAYRVTQLDGRSARTAPLAFPFQIRSVDFSGFDVIHAQGDDQLLRHAGRPVVRTLHGSSLDEAAANGIRAVSPKHLLLHGWFYAGEVAAAMRADAVTGVSHAAGRHVPRRVEVIPNGIDAARFAPDGTPKSASPSILFVGQLDSRKRGRWLTREFEKVRARVPGAELWLASPDQASGPGIVALGVVDDEELRRRYRRAWALCLPSTYEGFGRPYVEAMAAGTAVVASPNPGARDVLDGGRYGVIAEDANLAGALIDVLTDRTKREALERLGLGRATRYDWSAVVPAYEAVYARVLEGRARAAS
ncbi:MAG: glycosyltransferase family 4 protein [Acidobacteriota bacterium]|nr:glycosyltransferase family 4 protein [Acidobacteriota bacterium]